MYRRSTDSFDPATEIQDLLCCTKDLEDLDVEFVRLEIEAKEHVVWEEFKASDGRTVACWKDAAKIRWLNQGAVLATRCDHRLP